ncbi:phosphohydrolase [Elioraea rosea]|uniref:phosphohydrolase n=1 Tax=Elioraea rosea TaxID=2492390 RepID=UPI0011837126|nr:phosphohydrolase [Elioraea rosea]
MDEPIAERPRRPELWRADFSFVEKPALDLLDGAEWRMIEAQRKAYMQGRQAELVLGLFAAARGDPSFGYTLSMYDHGLQAATMALQSGADEEFVVVALLHDIGFTIAGPSHGEFAAALLRPYVSERNRWVLEMHQIFQTHHAHDHPHFDGRERDRFLGHPFFADAADFVARFDQSAIDPSFPTLPIEAFAPMVRRLFARPPARRFQVEGTAP